MRLIDRDPLTGESVHFAYDHANDQFTLIHEQDCANILDDNKRAVIENDDKAMMANDMIHYARIPNIVILEWKTKFGVDYFNREHTKKWMALLNSRDYRYLKRTNIVHDR